MNGKNIVTPASANDLFHQFQLAKAHVICTIKYNQSTINLMYTYKIVISIHGHSNTNTRELCAEHCHFSFGIYLQTKRTANEMQGRVST